MNSKELEAILSQKDSSDEARTMWDLLGVADHVAATFVFNYPTPSGWTAEVGRELGTEPRFVLTRGAD